MKKYTNNGKDFHFEGENIKIDNINYYCVNEAWLNAHGYYEYVEVADDGTDGVVDNKWVHYTGKPTPPPTPPTPPEPTPEELLEKARNEKLAAISAYDNSSAVNEFTLYGTPMWLDKATRVGLVNAVDAAESMGMVNVTLGLGGSSYTIPCTTARQMLYALEMYALECYNVTLAHTNDVKALETIDEINAYDYTTGYPTKLEFV